MCICMPNMMFLCLTLCQGEMCTDDDAETGWCQQRRMMDKAELYKAFWLRNRMSQKGNDVRNDRFKIMAWGPASSVL